MLIDLSVAMSGGYEAVEGYTLPLSDCTSSGLNYAVDAEPGVGLTGNNIGGLGV